MENIYNSLLTFLIGVIVGLLLVLIYDIKNNKK